MFTTNFGLSPLADSRDRAYALAVQQDQRIVVGGTSDAGNVFALDFALARHNPDGSLDATFGSGGRESIGFGGIGSKDELRDVLVQADGRILAAGFSDTGIQNVLDFALARLTADGIPDATFGVAGRVSTDISGTGSLDTAGAMALQADQRILLAGSSLRVSSDSDFALVRYNPDGSLDTGFGTGGKVTIDVAGLEKFDTGTDVAVQPDGKIVMVGTSTIATSPSVNRDFGIVRLDPDGTLDGSFGSGGRVSLDITGLGRDDKAFAVAIQEDGKILIGGQTRPFGGGVDFALARLNPDGTLDGTFGSGGIVITNFSGGTSSEQITRLILQPDRKILAAGTSFSRIAMTRCPIDPTPEALLEDLIAFVGGLGLLEGIQTSLLATLDHALEVLDPEDPGAICRLLLAFANQLSALGGKMQLSEGAADELLGRTEAIEEALACSG